MKKAYFDLSGTILKYGDNRMNPLMGDLLRSMSRHGWDLAVVSKYPPAECRRLLRQASVSVQPRILSARDSEKGGVLLEDIQTSPGQGVFVDDKPANLESVLRACGRRVRLIGFVGSRRYVPELSIWCRDNRVQLALSAVNLIEGLHVHVDARKAIRRPDDKLSEAELAALVPGLGHPESAIQGETRFFDHRAILCELLERKRTTDYSRLWSNLGWIGCNECLWKALVRSVLLSMDLDLRAVLGQAYKAAAYTKALKRYTKGRSCAALRKAFDAALKCMRRGIREIGEAAQECRIAGCNIEPDRLDRVQERIDRVLGG